MERDGEVTQTSLSPVYVYQCVCSERVVRQGAVEEYKQATQTSEDFTRLSTNMLLNELKATRSITLVKTRSPIS